MTQIEYILSIYGKATVAGALTYYLIFGLVGNYLKLTIYGRDLYRIIIKHVFLYMLTTGMYGIILETFSDIVPSLGRIPAMFCASVFMTITLSLVLRLFVLNRLKKMGISPRYLDQYNMEKI